MAFTEKARSCFFERPVLQRKVGHDFLQRRRLTTQILQRSGFSKDHTIRPDQDGRAASCRDGGAVNALRAHLAEFSPCGTISQDHTTLIWGQVSDQKGGCEKRVRPDMR
ncbi:hypothetical protein [Bradyrhizobium sp. CCGUVB23]|uniref:hypothetical protein n=1 Tax=Bradyrhizobium sp. CCGUVB23 TaxID=2949630 RepID=UPI0020B3FC30|nr:hypothetical protein [Bradyrhizobium sp. CCGUVB23]MCP3468673.1 hypothetical protein [Bradyrhizobium sp. CCGUVB23]